MEKYANLCFIRVISSLVNPRIFKCLFRSLTDKVTNSSSEMPQFIFTGDIGPDEAAAAAAAAAAAECI